MSDIDSIASLLSRLVAFPSMEGRTDHKQAVIRFAGDWLRERGVAVTDHPHADCPSLTARSAGKGAPILLLAHLDVVPAPDAMFTMRREGDKAFGRGVIDDKGPASVLLHLMAEAAAHPEWPALMIALTSDEEIGSDVGVKRLFVDGVFKDVRAVIALDGGSETRVGHREKGVLHVTLDAAGKTAHNSQPWTGDNAVEKLWRSIEAIKRSIGGDASAPDHWHHTVSVGTFQGGLFVNQTPGHASAKVDIRFTSPMTYADAVRAVEASLEPGVTIADAGGGDPYATDPADPLLSAYVRTMAASLGKDVALSSEHGATDAKVFASMGVPIWLHYPAGDGLHTDEEWLDLASAAGVLEGLRRFLSSGI